MTNATSAAHSCLATRLPSMPTPMRCPFLPLLALSLACCSDPNAMHAFTGPTMGSTYEVKYIGTVPVATVRAAVESELAAFDATFSNWRPDSEIARVNAHASTVRFPVSERFAAVLQLALDIAVATDGAFDPTVKPLSDLYRARKRDPEHRLDPAAAAAALARVGYRAVTLRDGAIEKARPDLALDLDGLVAGAAADAIAARLPQLGVANFYLQITGEVLCRGTKPDGQPWWIGVVDPAADAVGGELPIRTLALRDRALCTSGDYRNGFEHDGTFVHHVFDPRTGQNPTHRVVSASVLADRAAVADALGTAFLVLGPEGTQAVWPALQQFGVHGALLLSPAGDGTLTALEIAWPKDDS